MKVKTVGYLEGTSITVREAGKLGGLATLKNHGFRFFQEIGRKGGQRTKEKYGALLNEFGKKGGRPKLPTL